MNTPVKGLAELLSEVKTSTKLVKVKGAATIDVKLIYMKNIQKGFAALIIIVIVAALVVGGAIYLTLTKPEVKTVQNESQSSLNKDAGTTTISKTVNKPQPIVAVSLTKGQVFKKILDDVKVRSFPLECLIFIETDGKTIVDPTNPSFKATSADEYLKSQVVVSNSYVYQVNEKRGGTCEGDATESPLLFNVKVDKTGGVTFFGETGYYKTSIDTSSWKTYLNQENKFQIQYRSNFSLEDDASKLDYGRRVITFRKDKIIFRIMIGAIMDSSGKIAYDKMKQQYIVASDAHLAGDSVITEPNLFYKEGMPAFSILDLRNNQVVSHILLIQRTAPYDYFEINAKKTDGTWFSEEEEITIGQMIKTLDIQR